MGQKYGSRPFPTHIPQSEFELLMSVMRDDEEVLNLINTWFKIDDNSIPPCYVLQPINSILTHFNETVSRYLTWDCISRSKEKFQLPGI